VSGHTQLNEESFVVGRRESGFVMTQLISKVDPTICGKNVSTKILIIWETMTLSSPFDKEVLEETSCIGINFELHIP
jgi:hypothetical protein